MDQLAEITGIQPKHRPFAATQVFESRGENFTANNLVEGSTSVLENKRDRKKPAVSIASPTSNTKSKSFQARH